MHETFSFLTSWVHILSKSIDPRHLKLTQLVGMGSVKKPIDFGDHTPTHAPTPGVLRNSCVHILNKTIVHRSLKLSGIVGMVSVMKPINFGDHKLVTPTHALTPWGASQFLCIQNIYCA